MHLPRILLAAPSSGTGKTTVTCGILQALVNRGCKISSFKCGPDYVDPMFHSKVIGTKAYNLDPFMMKQETMEYLLCKNSTDTDIAIIEGVMGYYDGLGGNTITASTYSVATATQTPTVLIVNAKGMSTSIVPAIKGFLDYTTDHTIQGVILNQISSMMYPRLKELIEKQLPVNVYGYLPILKDFVLESRPLGLIPADELPNLKQQLQALAEQIEPSIDIDGLIRLASSASALTPNTHNSKLTNKNIVNQYITIGVAKDSAFCFYYEDNLKLLAELGAKLVYFSPMYDTALPNQLDGVLLGGGYVDHYAKELSQNNSMRQSIHTAIKEGLPCIAEGSGFAYLHQTVEDKLGQAYPMVGLLQEQIKNADRLQHFGYFTLTANNDTLLLAKGEQTPTHEFHYQYSSHEGTACTAVKSNGTSPHDCIYSNGNLWAGFPHLHFYANSSIVTRFINACKAYQNANKRK